MGRLDGKVALVTGGAGGQGAAIAGAFVAEGAQVVVADVRDDAGASVAAELGAAASFVHLDVALEDDWAAASDQVRADHGRLDVCVNNAGVFALTPIVHATAADYRRLVEINQISVFLGIQAAARLMGRGSAIINVSSICGLRGGGGTIAYTATKFAVTGMTKVAAIELAPRGIRVNSIHPGFVDTPMLDDVLRLIGPDARAQMAAKIPIGALSEGRDIAAMALFLASDESRHCTGAEFPVDGGLAAGMGLLP